MTYDRARHAVLGAKLEHTHTCWRNDQSVAQICVSIITVG